MTMLLTRLTIYNYSINIASLGHLYFKTMYVCIPAKVLPWNSTLNLKSLFMVKLELLISPDLYSNIHSMFTCDLTRH